MLVTLIAYIFLALTAAHAATLHRQPHELPDKELKLVHVIFRHGTRTPADTYPTDPYINETFDPFGWGALTNVGKQDMYGTGLFIRERYNDFLGDTYNAKEFYVQTTDADRTKMTAQLMNAGIWPPTGWQLWGKLKWQPIPTNYEPLSQDMLLLVRLPCAQYSQELERVQEEGELKEKMDANVELFQNLTEVTGMKIKDFEDVQSLYSTLKAEEVFGLDLPQWTKDYYPQPLQELTELSFVVNAYTDKLKRLKGGVLLKKIMSDYSIKSGHGATKISKREAPREDDSEDAYKLLEAWTKETKNTTPKQRKMVLYAGHDSTVSNLLSALKVWDPQVPGYGITVFMELSKDTATNELGVEVFLRNDTSVPPYKLTVPGCESFCPLTKLAKLVEPVIPRNWGEECKSDDPHYVPPPPGGP